MIKIECDHCKSIVNKENAVKVEWKEYNIEWYYCTSCNTNCFNKQ